ncbi:enoyl-CoA hydratase-related protein [Sphingomonas immobilis]|uniref:Enoyl-CoA hydratase-related protein n=1 Tax=Sphingomonas immobilis TaxID=3063997 RepID=A0ABT8ZWV0_9SPHN|nr:enoyl-CoA hydratase-related protein [Sphingomonas sp. CA1-15]MDO7842067.1 enoyl-CoA hydratase-related protein [Sphingomonas sp. CA1-15]
MDYITVAKADHVTTVTLNRPEVMNAINGGMHNELQVAFDDFAADDDQFVCVVTGAGEKAFCAGSDLKAVAVRGEHPVYPRNGYAGLIERFDCPKPMIAAVNGLALGGGFEVALACDLIIAVESASFGLPEPLVGAIAFGGGLHRLAREIGPKRAMGMILTARRVSAAEGLRLGFVNEVVAAGELDAAVARWVAEILRAAPPALRASKEVVYRGLDEPSLEAALTHQSSYPAYVAWRDSQDVKEGPLAFAEKREPKWTGK